MGTTTPATTVPCKNCKDADYGITDFLKAKLSGYARGSTQEARKIMCTLCQERIYHPDNRTVGERLFRKVNGKSYCGQPRSKKLRRDSFSTGCGCHLEDKVRWKASKCPRDLWGPEQERHTGLKGKGVVNNGDMQLILPGSPSIPAKYLKTKRSANSVLHEIKLIKLEANGIGDLCVAAGVVAGLKAKYPKRLIGFGVRGHLVKWAELFNDADYVFANELLEDSEFAWVGYPNNGKVDYEFPTRGKTAWPIAAAKVCRCKFTIPKIKIPELDSEWATAVDDALGSRVILAPYSMYNYRTWNLNRWIKLEEALHSAGYSVHIVDGPGNKLNMFKGTKHAGLSPGRLMALVKTSELVIGNDSGPAHIAGVLNVPTLAIMGPTKGSSIFGSYPKAQWVESNLACAACYWHTSSGWDEACYHGCEALSSISFSDVWKSVKEALKC